MAESAVAFLLAKINDLLTYETGLILGLDKEIRSLHSQLQWIRSFLRDAEGKSKKNELVKIWVRQVRDVAYDAEDVIDAFILEKQQQRRHGEGIVGRLTRFIGLPSQLRSSHRFGAEIEEIKKRIEDISANKTKFCIEAIQEGETSNSLPDSRPSRQLMANFIEEVDAVGIEGDVKLLVHRLTNIGEKRRAVVSIVGMGGLGKTTLAKKLYGNTIIRKHFDCLAWITMSQAYNLRALMRRLRLILNVGEMEMADSMDEESLRQMLAEYLKERRYLIVVDDIWSTRGWDDLVPAFPDKMNGSRVILTTRNREIALYADAVSVPHELKFLPESKSWELFCSKAFPGSIKAKCPSELERLAKDIVAKCGGLPLAIVVIGGMLSRQERALSKWQKLYKSISWHLCEGQNNISGIFGLSYHDLPYYLKSCFLYCGVFPEDAEIPARKLIKLWVAEGFIQNRGAETMEEVAEDYLEELICRSLIQVARKRLNRQVKTCRIHDILRDLAISEAKEGKLYEIYPDGESESLEVVGGRRLVAYNGNFTLSYSSNHLRSFLRFSKDGDLHKTCLRNLINHSSFLRVLDLEGVRISRLPTRIRDLVHLRYLGLRKTGIKNLEGCIGEPCHLQTLDIRETDCRRLPKELSKNRFLRHLCMGRCSFQISRLVNETLLHFPGQVEVENMRNLETLTGVAAGRWIDSLGKLTNLRRLGIGQLSRIDGMPLATSVQNLNNLNSLWLEGETIPTLKLAGHYNLYKMYLLGCLEKLPNLKDFPENLTKLFLQSSDLKKDPFLLLMELPRLRILGLLKAAYLEKKLKCFKGGFLELEELIIQLSEVEDWEIEIGGMPKLRSMSLVGCEKLVTLPEGMAYMTTLRNLNLIDMPHRITDHLSEFYGGREFEKIEHIQSVKVIDSSC